MHQKIYWIALRFTACPDQVRNDRKAKSAVFLIVTQPVRARFLYFINLVAGFSFTHLLNLVSEDSNPGSRFLKYLP